MYKTFAYYYDQMMDIDYTIFTDLVEKYLSKEGFLLDAGCGTGSIMVPLLQKGYQVVGVDNSTAMLEIAQKKIKEQGLYAPLYENNLLEPLANASFQSVISFLDVINYIDDFSLVFKNIYDALLPGGLFLFDVHQVGYVNELIGYEEVDDYNNFSYHWQVEAGNEENSIVHKLTIMSGDNRYYEEHFQRTYSAEVYINALKKIGFIPQILSESDNVKLFICARKPSER